MKLLRKLRLTYWVYFSKPVADRVVFRTMRSVAPKSIVQLGLGEIKRTVNWLQFLKLAHPELQVQLATIDPFEGRENGLSLKQVHQTLGPIVSKLRLVPGEPASALTRTANSLPNTDLLVIAGGIDAEALASGWYFVPRMLHEKSVVLIEEPHPKTGTAYRTMSFSDVESLSENVRKTTRRAA